MAGRWAAPSSEVSEHDSRSYWRPLMACLTLLLFAPAHAQQANMTFFVTSIGSGKGADLGGLSGADRHCQQLASAVGRGQRLGMRICRHKVPVLKMRGSASAKVPGSMPKARLLQKTSPSFTATITISPSRLL